MNVTLLFKILPKVMTCDFCLFKNFKKSHAHPCLKLDPIPEKGEIGQVFDCEEVAILADKVGSWLDS